MGSKRVYAPVFFFIVWCAGLLLLCGFADTEDGVWRQEYENCMAAMEQGIAEYRMEGEQDLPECERRARDGATEIWQEILEAFSACVQECIENQSEGMGGEEGIYRNAVLLMAAVCEDRGDSYEFAYVQEEVLERGLEDFRAVLKGGNPIDKSIESFQEDFAIYHQAEILISEKLEQAWQGEFYHCLDVARDRAGRLETVERGQILEVLGAWEDFFELWAEKEIYYRQVVFRYEMQVNTEEMLEWVRTGGGLTIWQEKGRAEVFRTGTLLLIGGLEKAGGSYAFSYDSEADRQELTELLGIRPGTEEGTWKQEYEICLAAMDSMMPRSDVGAADLPYEYLEDWERQECDRSMELWRDALSAFDECVAVCVRSQPGGRDGEEDIYQTAVLLMKAMCEKRNGHYTLAHGHGEDLEKAQEDFEAVLNRGNPIDECRKFLYEEFGSFHDAAFEISARMEEAWQEEFYHCLDVVRDRVRQSDPAKQKPLLEILETLEDFIETWAEDEEKYECIYGGSSMGIRIAGARAGVFRIGTLLLADGLERSGGSYEFLYDGEADRLAFARIVTGKWRWMTGKNGMESFPQVLLRKHTRIL